MSKMLKHSSIPRISVNWDILDITVFDVSSPDDEVIQVEGNITWVKLLVNIKLPLVTMPVQAFLINPKLAIEGKI